MSKYTGPRVRVVSELSCSVTQTHEAELDQMGLISSSRSAVHRRKMIATIATACMINKYSYVTFYYKQARDLIEYTLYTFNAVHAMQHLGVVHPLLSLFSLTPGICNSIMPAVVDSALRQVGMDWVYSVSEKVLSRVSGGRAMQI